MGSLGTILQSDNTTRVARSQYDRKVIEREATNKRSAAASNLSNFMRSLANNTRQANAGKEYSAAVTQLSHELEQAGKDKLSAQVAHAEASGALAAEAANAGVGGASIDIMDGLIDLQRATQEQEQDRALLFVNRGGRQATSHIMSEAASSLDLGRSYASVDYNKDLRPKGMEHKWLTVVGVLVAGFYGGESGAKAASESAIAEWKARNGDFAGAGESFGGALAGLGDAINGWKDRGGSWASQFSSGDSKNRALWNNAEKTGAKVKGVNPSKEYFSWGGKDTGGSKTKTKTGSGRR